MARFVLRLKAPRTSFPGDMTAEEAALMQAHVAHWMPLMQAGRVPVFGPVLDPAGVWGLLVLDAPSLADAEGLAAADPVIKSCAGFSFDVLPMLDPAHGGSRPDNHGSA